MKTASTTGLLIFSVLAGCRYVTKAEIEVSERIAYRCGRYESRIYVRSPIIEEYPDLGIILANANVLELSPNERALLEEKARECYAICEEDLNRIRMLEDDLKNRIAVNEMKGNMTAVAADLNLIEAEKQIWLQHHRQCYREGLQLLSPASLARWLPHENRFKSLEPQQSGR